MSVVNTILDMNSCLSLMNSDTNVVNMKFHLTKLIDNEMSNQYILLRVTHKFFEFGNSKIQTSRTKKNKTFLHNGQIL